MFFSNNAGHLVNCAILEDYLNDRISSLKQFNSKGNTDQESNIPSLAALSSAMRLIKGYRLPPS
jgi:amidase